jgi:hypothetical protein
MPTPEDTTDHQLPSERKYQLLADVHLPTTAFMDSISLLCKRIQGVNPDPQLYSDLTT